MLRKFSSVLCGSVSLCKGMSLTVHNIFEAETKCLPEVEEPILEPDNSIELESSEEISSNDIDVQDQEEISDLPIEDEME